MNDELLNPQEQISEERLIKSVRQAVEVCVGVITGENVVVITDKRTEGVAKYITDEVKRITPNLQIFSVEGQEGKPRSLPAGALESVKESDATFIIADYVEGDMENIYGPLGEADIIQKTRMAVMAGIDKRVLAEGMQGDYRQVKEFSNKVHEVVKDAKEIKVATDLGADFTVTLKNNRWAVFDGFPAPGKWVNLPDGEVLTTPFINGKVVLDGIAEFLGILGSNPITLEVRDNRIVPESIKCTNEDVKIKFMDLVLNTDDNSSRVGEFAFGTNLFLSKLSGNLLQDEKFPSIHIAFGKPHSSITGNQEEAWDSRLHMDCLVMKTTVSVDGKTIMEQGEYLI